MPAVIETPTQKSPDNSAHVKSTPSPHRKKGLDSPKQNSLSGCSNKVATLHAVGHGTPMEKMQKGNVKKNVIDFSVNESMYSLERWLTEGGKEGPWTLLRPHTSIHRDALIQKPKINGANDVNRWSMIEEIGEDNLLEDGILPNFDDMGLSA